MEEEHKSHARVADVINLIIGLWLIVSPFVMGFTFLAGPMWNNIIFGVLISVLALVRLYSPEQAEWLSWANALFGLWLVFSPFIISYPGMVEAWENIIAGVVVVIAGWRSAMETRMYSPTSRERMA